jgi:hypothetical protein
MPGFVIGNGLSRKSVDLSQLKNNGTTYGCNALYREFTPDVLVACDPLIAKEIEKSGYALKHKFYTRNPLPDLGALQLGETYQRISSGIRLGYSSGPNALHLAANNHTMIYILGFDYGSTGNTFNNCYADTEFYKKSLDEPTTGDNWLIQTLEIIKSNPTVSFVRVTNDKSASFPALLMLDNFSHLPIDMFQEKFQ